MIIVIIAGGSGTRLWPLSQSNYPKHLLKLTGEKSLLQNTVARASQLSERVYVVTEQSHAGEVAKQLPELPPERIMSEPGRRGTASCIVLALATIASQTQGDEPVVFLHADAHITNQEEFALSVERAAAASTHNQRITLIGVEPTYPATGFGYIHRGSAGPDHTYEVRSFKEKPDADTAAKYLASGEYLWNMGLFAAPLSVYKRAFADYAPDLAKALEDISKVIGDPERLSEVYLALNSQPIDTALIEKDPKLLVVPGSFDWADIGSFFDLHKIIQNSDKNSLKGDIELVDSDDVMVHTSGTKPVVVIGLSGVVVVDSPEGLLVCAKEKSQLVGDAAKKLAKKAQAKR